MTMYPGTSTQQPAAICALKSPADAIHILEAVRLGIVPRVTRRLTGHERSMIRPGTVWVWEEEETNMRRWTDGRRWGASRVGGGGFLVYTESSDSLSPPPSRPDSPTYNSNPYYGNGRDGSSSTPPRRPEPLVKQTYSTSMTHPVTGKVKKFHVVAYSSKRNPQGYGANALPLPHQLPNLASIKITPGIWPDWETRRDDYGARRAPTTPHGHPAHVPLPPRAPGHPHGHPHSHVPPHPMAATGPATPVTATAVPYPPPESFHPAPPRQPPPSADGRLSPSEPHPPHDARRYAPYYDPYDPHRPPYPPYDMYPPERYPPPPDRYHPYYPPPSRGAHDVPPGHPLPPPPPPPPGDYRYDERMFDREREMREREDPAARRSPPRGYYAPPPPPPHPYYRDPRDPYAPPPPRDGAYPPPREGSFPPSREGPYPPREGSYPPPPPPGVHGQHLGKRGVDDRPPPDMPDPKRVPSWSPATHNGRLPPGHHPEQPPPDRGMVPMSHARHGSSGSHTSSSHIRGDPRETREAWERQAREAHQRELRDRDPRERDMRERDPRARSRSPPRHPGSASGNVTLPPLRDAITDKNAEAERMSPRGGDRDVAWGRVPA